MNARWFCPIALLSCTRAPPAPVAPAPAVELPYAPSSFARLIGDRHWIVSSASNRCEPFHYVDGERPCATGFQRVYLDAVATHTSLYGSRITLQTTAIGTSASGCIRGITVGAVLSPRLRDDNHELVELDPEAEPDGPDDVVDVTSYILTPDRPSCEREASAWVEVNRAADAQTAAAHATEDAERREVCAAASRPVMLGTGDPFKGASVTTPAALRAGVAPQVGPHDRLTLLPGTAAASYRNIVLVGTTAEIASARRFLESAEPCRFAGRRFERLGDIDERDATPAQIAELGRDAGLALETSEHGWAVTCWTCNAFEVVTALAALGVQVKTP